MKPSAEQRKPSPEQLKPSTEQVKPWAEQIKPPVERMTRLLEQNETADRATETYAEAAKIISRVRINIDAARKRSIGTSPRIG